MHRPAPVFALGVLLSAACAPPAPQGAVPGHATYVVRVSTGDREGVQVDWAILPDEGWPVDGRRDRTPFSTELPGGQVAAIFRSRTGSPPLQLVLLKRLPDGTLKRITVADDLTLGVVVIDPGTRREEILGSSARPGTD